MHACCLRFSSRETLSFPLCFADSLSTSNGEKYALYSLTLAALDDSGMPMRCDTDQSVLQD